MGIVAYSLFGGSAGFIASYSGPAENPKPKP